MNHQLFPNELPILLDNYSATKDIDWTVLPYSQDLLKFSKEFLSAAYAKDTRTKYERLYKIYSDLMLEDPNFLEQISSKDKDRFHQRTWEMWLAVILHEAGYKVEASRANHGPDLLVNNSTYIECVANKDTSNELIIPPDFSVQKYALTNEFTEKVNLRLTQVIDAKYKKYQKYVIDQVVDPNLPYIIAINSFAVLGYPHIVTSYLPQTIHRILHGLGNLLEIKDHKRIYTSSPTIQKKVGVEVDANLFESNKYADISAIVICDTSITDLLCGDLKPLGLFQNIHAKNKLPKNFILSQFQNIIEVPFIGDKAN